MTRLDVQRKVETFIFFVGIERYYTDLHQTIVHRCYDTAPPPPPTLTLPHSGGEKTKQKEKEKQTCYS